MKSGKSYTGEEEFIRAYWDQIADITHDGSLLVESGTYLSARRGIVRVYWEVYRLNRLPQPPTPVVRYDAEYPNATAGSLPAFLFASATKVAHMVDNWLANEERALRSKGS